MYDRIVKAVRAKDDSHLCVIHDGFMGMGTLPVPTKYGWTDVVYSTHLFEWNADTYEYALDLRCVETVFIDQNPRSV